MQGRNDEDMPYQCPACLRQGLVQRQRKPISMRPQSMLEAVELPKCDLSEHLQKHLDKAVAGACSLPPCRSSCVTKTIACLRMYACVPARLAKEARRQRRWTPFAGMLPPGGAGAPCSGWSVATGQYIA